MSMELELLAAIYSTLHGDSTLLSSGINPATGNSRSVSVYNQPPQDAPLPYIRLTVTDSVPLSKETYDLNTQPTVKTVSMLIDCWSDYDPCVMSICNHVEVLLRHAAITTTNYQGSTWITSTDYFVDNTSYPDRLYKRGTIRLRANLEPKG